MKAPRYLRFLIALALAVILAATIFYGPKPEPQVDRLAGTGKVARPRSSSGLSKTELESQVSRVESGMAAALLKSVQEQTEAKQKQIGRAHV